MASSSQVFGQDEIDLIIQTTGAPYTAAQFTTNGTLLFGPLFVNNLPQGTTVVTQNLGLLYGFQETFAGNLYTGLSQTDTGFTGQFLITAGPPIGHRVVAPYYTVYPGGFITDFAVLPSSFNFYFALDSAVTWDPFDTWSDTNANVWIPIDQATSPTTHLYAIGTANPPTGSYPQLLTGIPNPFDPDTPPNPTYSVDPILVFLITGAANIRFQTSGVFNYFTGSGTIIAVLPSLADTNLADPFILIASPTTTVTVWTYENPTVTYATVSPNGFSVFTKIDSSTWLRTYGIPQPTTAGYILTDNGSGVPPTFSPPPFSSEITGDGTVISTGPLIASAGNITLTLVDDAANTVLAGPTSGGSAAPTFRSLVAADIPAIDLTTAVTGTLPVANGGTGFTTLPQYDIVMANGASAFTGITPSATSGWLLESNGSSAAPTFTAPIFSSQITGDGTIISTGPLTSSSGNISLTLVSDAANTVLAGPTTGSAAAPTFRSLVAADIPAISLTSGVSGTLPVANGGTGTTSITQFDVVMANGSGAFTGIAPSSGGLVLTSTGPSSAPTFQSIPAQGSVTNFSFTNQDNVSGTVTNATTTPNLAIAPSGSSLVAGGFASWDTSSNLKANNLLVSTLSQTATTPTGAAKYVFTITSNTWSVGNTWTNNGFTFTALNAGVSAIYLYCSGTGSPTSGATTLVGSPTITVSSSTGVFGLTIASAEAQRFVSGSGTVLLVMPDITTVTTGISYSLDVDNSSTVSIVPFENPASPFSITTAYPGSFGVVIYTGSTWDVYWGSPSSAIWSNIGLQVAGTLTATGLTSTDGVLYGATGGLISQTNVGSSGQMLTSNGSGNAPTFTTPVSVFAFTNGANVTGTVTNATSAPTLALAPTSATPTATSFASWDASSNFTAVNLFSSNLTNTNGVLYGGTSGQIFQTTVGTSGQALTSNGTGVAPTFQTITTLPNPNLCYNADFYFNNRYGTNTATFNASSTLTYYCADRWCVAPNIGGSGTVTAVTQGGSKTINQLQITVGTSGSSGEPALIQVIAAEDANIYLQDQVCSFSCWIKGVANTNSIGLQFFRNSTSSLSGATFVGSESSTSVNSSNYVNCTLSNQSIGTPSSTGVVGIRIRIKGVGSGHAYTSGNGFRIELAYWNVGATPVTTNANDNAPSYFQLRFGTHDEELAACSQFYQNNFGVNNGTSQTTPPNSSAKIQEIYDATVISSTLVRASIPLSRTMGFDNNGVPKNTTVNFFSLVPTGATVTGTRTDGCWSVLSPTDGVTWYYTSTATANFIFTGNVTSGSRIVASIAGALPTLVAGQSVQVTGGYEVISEF